MRSTGRIHMKHCVQGLRRRHVMRHRTNATDPGCDLWHLLRGPSLDKFLEAAKLRNLKIRPLDFACVIKEHGDFPVAFQPRDGIDDDCSFLAFTNGLNRCVRHSEPPRFNGYFECSNALCSKDPGKL